VSTVDSCDCLDGQSHTLYHVSCSSTTVDEALFFFGNSEIPDADLLLRRQNLAFFMQSIANELFYDTENCMLNSFIYFCQEVEFEAGHLLVSKTGYLEYGGMQNGNGTSRKVAYTRIRLSSSHQVQNFGWHSNPTIGPVLISCKSCLRLRCIKSLATFPQSVQVVKVFL
jgi:hypothetical protein